MSRRRAGSFKFRRDRVGEDVCAVLARLSEYYGVSQIDVVRMLVLRDGRAVLSELREEARR